MKVLFGLILNVMSREKYDRIKKFASAKRYRRTGDMELSSKYEDTSSKFKSKDESAYCGSKPGKRMVRALGWSGTKDAKCTGL